MDWLISYGLDHLLFWIICYFSLAKQLGPTGKRLDYITWHQHHMFMAQTLKEMSPLSEEKACGCYIVDQEHYQIASGFSGQLDSSEHDVSCSHAISVALLRMQRVEKSGEDCVMYTSRFPECAECVKRIREAKISKIVYWVDDNDDVDREEDKDSLEIDGVTCEKYRPMRRISIDFY
uniref:dCMP deaminase n=1 Tax=Caenorhabditis japonica TaxID=281687 RepID=A0A8R1IGG9_CAEJA